jgi:hypothetical protein
MRAMAVSCACHALHLDWRLINSCLAVVFRDAATLEDRAHSRPGVPLTWGFRIQGLVFASHM